ncbi:class I glutamine amidotransferase-like protein [Aspergillus taichungensis]|uniref:Class I glutamine amidotransferase-like protein n=1 Tax=Aspergillus taichungensis TaxID=482145 RepID=A0A2J5HGY1_9EURO|nr:class I glutamine amidotransferase-like protein [Aspergillus taichungensis]
MTIHLAILDVDIPVRPHYHRNGLYSTQYRSIIEPAVHRLSQSHLHPDPIELVVSSWDILGGVYPPEHLLQPPPATTASTTTTNNNNKHDKITSLLITGSASSAYQTTTNPWITPLKTFIRRIYTHHPHIKLIGGCFGHQLIAAALLPDSTRVEQCPFGREVGVHAVRLAPRFERAFGPVLGGKRALRMQMMHGDWVVSSSYSHPANLPSPWLNIGWTEQCPIQGLYLPGRVLTLQGHFEIDSGGMSIVASEFGPALGWSAEVARMHQERIAWEGGVDDGDVVADVVALFIVGGDLVPVSKL